MRHRLSCVLACGSLLFAAVPSVAQVDPTLAMNKPDQLSWQLFIQVNSRAGGTNATFETFASDSDTFVPSPQYPIGPVASSMRPPILPAFARATALRNGMLLPAVPPNPALSLEETRRNKSAFDFIVQNNLYTVTGLQAAFGKTLTFPTDAIEVKANWVPVSQIPAFTNNQVTLDQVPQLYHVNTASDQQQYALVAMHIITKLVPNWTWATFEHRFNPGRCDIISCRDSFGAQTPVVGPLLPQGQTYPDCVKSPALTALLAQANIEPAYVNYCLKGSQVDFVDNTGLDIRLGNTVAERGFVDSASCITCHSRAGFTQAGGDATVDSNGNGGAGFLPTGGPLGPLLPAWYWTFTGQPPIFEGMPGLARTATSADFVWSIPLCAIDDTQNPPPPTACAGK
jgi:hypothetical protein